MENNEEPSLTQDGTKKGLNADLTAELSERNIDRNLHVLDQSDVSSMVARAQATNGLVKWDPTKTTRLCTR